MFFIEALFSPWSGCVSGALAQEFSSTATPYAWEEVRAAVSPSPQNSDLQRRPICRGELEIPLTWNFLANIRCQIIAQREAAGLPTDVVPEKVTQILSRCSHC